MINKIKIKNQTLKRNPIFCFDLKFNILILFKIYHLILIFKSLNL